MMLPRAREGRNKIERINWAQWIPANHYIQGTKDSKSMVFVELEPLGLPATSWFAWIPWGGKQKRHVSGHLELETLLA